MTTPSVRMLAGLFAGLLVCTGPAAPGADTQDQAVARGKRIYEQLCSGCHGASGEGDTFKAWALSIEPRDLTSGTYKLRSTPRGSLPTDEDLHRTIQHGILRSAMPQYRRLSDEDVDAVVAYVKTLSDRWARERPGPAVEIPDPPEDLMSKRSVARGREVYGLLQCGSCHGETGRGDGPMAERLDEDAWGHQQRTADLTRGIYKSGDTEQGLYRAIAVGLEGTAMHAYGSLFTEAEGKRVGPRDAWHLVAYILSLRGR